MLAGFGEELFGVAVAAGGLVQPRLPAAILNHGDGLPGPLGLTGMAMGGAQRPQDLAHATLADPDQPGHLSEGEPLATLGLPQPPQLGDPLGAGQGAAPQRGQGATHIVLAHLDLAGDLGRIQRLATGDLAGLVELFDLLQRPVCRPTVLELGSAAAGVGRLQCLELLRQPDAALWEPRRQVRGIRSSISHR